MIDTPWGSTAQDGGVGPHPASRAHLGSPTIRLPEVGTIDVDIKIILGEPDSILSAAW